MTSESVERVLLEAALLTGPEGDPELEAVRTAILLEDVLGVRLSDADIRPEILGDPAAVRALLAGTAGPD